MTKPIDTIRDGRLSASIWANASNANGSTFYAVTFERMYTDDENNIKNSSSFSGAELLQISELSRSAYQRISELRAESAPSANGTSH